MTKRTSNIRIENYGGGVRWHCTNCDRKSSSPGSHLPVIQYTNSPPPLWCERCATEAENLYETATVIKAACDDRKITKITGEILKQNGLVPAKIHQSRMSGVIRALSR